MSLMRKSYWSSSFLLSYLILATTTLIYGHNLTKEKACNKSSVTSIFIFGDSTVDAGNNNYIETLVKSDFSPYGIDFPDQSPTGRFTNGRLATDFLASYLGVKEIIPAYLDSNLSIEDLITGVSFASAGTGYDLVTAQRSKVINLEAQLQFFDEYKKKLQQLVGKRKMEYNVKHAAYIISCGSNDIIYTYGPDYFPPVPEKVTTYLQFMHNRSIWFLEALKDKGARKIGIVGLPPVGCLPIMMTIHPSMHNPRSCVQSLSSMASDFNKMLKHEVAIMQASQPNSIIFYVDIYGPLQDQLNNPYKYGFEVANKGCCGTGLSEAAVLCNSLSSICNDRSKYIFWDAIHPTEKSYYFVFQALRPILASLLRELN